VTFTVTIEPSALDQIAGFLTDDPAGVRELIAVIDSLQENPKPPHARSWGTDHYRLRHGSWRILYRIAADRGIVHVEHVGWTR
jgi:mRNA interferase RelE/StbE